MAENDASPPEAPQAAPEPQTSDAVSDPAPPARDAVTSPNGGVSDPAPAAASAATQDARAQDAPAQDASAQDAPAQDAPAQDAPAQNAPAGEAADAVTTVEGSTEGSTGGEASPAEGEAQADATTVAGADAPAKRKRKRKRKRKGAGGEGAPEAAEGGRKKKDAHSPFGHLFAGAAKRHAFAVGEVVAGRVAKVEHGAIVVDLFGKALAIADEFEPRDVPVLPDPPAPETSEPEQADTAAPAAAAPEAAASDAAAPEGSTADEGAGELATAPADAAAAEPQADGAAEPPPVEAAAQEAPAVAALTATEAPGPQPDATPDDGAVSSEGTDEASAPADAGELAAASDADADTASDAGDTSAGDAQAPRSNLPPVPVVPEDLPRPEPVELGAIFRGRVGAVSESGHIAILNRLVDVPAVRAQMEQHRADRRRVEGLVFGFNRGGFDVLVAGIRGFCPASAMSLHEINDPSALVGQRLQFLLPQAKPVGKDVIVTRRSILEREARKRAKELIKTLQPGMRVKGQVSSVREFGLFVDLGGIEGLVHQSELSYVFGTKPQDVASPGDEIEVQVLRVGGGEGKKGGDGRSDKRSRTTRVSLSLKALQPDPWDAHADAVAEGTVRCGKITRTTDFGAFVELAPGIEGLVHISDFGRDLKHTNQAVKEGEDLHVVVERADRKARRISLSRLTATEIEDFQSGKLAETGEGAPKKLRSGSTLTVTIDKVEQRGVHVRVPGVIGKRARGYLPGNETGLERGADLRKAFPIGQEVEVKVIGTDRDGGLRCSVKALQLDEERKAIKDYRREASKQGFGTFGDLLKAKLGG